MDKSNINLQFLIFRVAWPATLGAYIVVPPSVRRTAENQWIGRGIGIAEHRKLTAGWYWSEQNATDILSTEIS